MRLALYEVVFLRKSSADEIVTFPVEILPHV